MTEDKLKIDEMLENEIEAELAEETNDEDVQEYMTEEEYMEKDGMDRLFEGGPTYDQVAEWKSRFNGEIYMSDFGQDTFIWRPLRRNEYKTMQRAEGQNEMFMEHVYCGPRILGQKEWRLVKLEFLVCYLKLLQKSLDLFVRQLIKYKNWGRAGARPFLLERSSL